MSTWIRRPVEDKDFAVVALESTGGVDGEPVKTEEMVLEIGGGDTFEAFTENLRGLTPGDEKDFAVTYPAEYGAQRLAGRTVQFHATLKGLRRKELPEVNDEFAQDWAITAAWTNSAKPSARASSRSASMRPEQEARTS